MYMIFSKHEPVETTNFTFLFESGNNLGKERHR